MKKCLIFVLISGIILVLLGLCGFFFARHKYNELCLPYDTEGKSSNVVFEVEPGAACGMVADKLEKEKLIRSADVFYFIGRQSGKGSQIKSGYFNINASMTPEEILDVFVNGKEAVKKITFPEGLTLKQCAAAAAKNKICTEEEFLKAVKKGGKAYSSFFPDNMEGYFLPDTYSLPWVCSAEQLVKIASLRFEELAVPCHDSSSPLSLKDTIILASLVEREAQVESERPIIAGVYINRLNADMKLECDATVQFALGRQKEFLLYKDLEIDSPYNTYKYKGLPAGPICNPGLASIKAACHPAKSPYYYYVRNDVKGDGSHVFGRDFSEHQRNIREYQR